MLLEVLGWVFVGIFLYFRCYWQVLPPTKPFTYFIHIIYTCLYIYHTYLSYHVSFFIIVHIHFVSFYTLFFVLVTVYLSSHNSGMLLISCHLSYSNHLHILVICYYVSCLHIPYKWIRKTLRTRRCCYHCTR